MLKLGMVATAATATTTASTLNQQPSLIRPGISYNQVVKANEVCHLSLSKSLFKLVKSYKTCYVTSNLFANISIL